MTTTEDGGKRSWGKEFTMLEGSVMGRSGKGGNEKLRAQEGKETKGEGRSYGGGGSER